MSAAPGSAPRRVLLIGPLPIAGDVVGGTKVSFAELAGALGRDEGLALTVHDTSRPRAGRGAVARRLMDLGGLLKLLQRLAAPRARFDAVLFNTSSGGLVASGPLVAAVCRWRGWPLTVRVFGGDLDLVFARTPRVWRWVLGRTVLRAERVLLQTHALCERFAPHTNVAWWPTTRELSAHPRPARSGPVRFLFLAQLRREKGVAEAALAAERLPEGAHLTVHGPAMPGFDIAELPASPRWSYGGAVPSADVPRVLAAHDVLVFPTYHVGEGMPGIVIEAMQAGLPVVATRFRALEELVRDGVEGLLVPARDVDALAAALQRLAADPLLLARLGAAARARGDEFRTSRWLTRLRGWLGAPEVARVDPEPTRELTPRTAERGSVRAHTHVR